MIRTIFFSLLLAFVVLGSGVCGVMLLDASTAVEVVFWSFGLLFTIAFGFALGVEWIEDEP